jgi:hypothetical protein
MDTSFNNLSIYNGVEATAQNIYDSYNNFIFSKDIRVFNKMIKRTELYLDVKGVVGDILEFGVFTPFNI